MRRILVIALMALFVAPPAFATPRLDPTFGVGGVVAVPGVNPSGMQLTSEGILVAGEVVADPDDDSIGFARVTDDGQPDPTFGIGGVVAIDRPLAAATGYGYRTGGVFLGADGRPTVAYGDLASGHASPSAPCLASVDATGSPASAVSGRDCGQVAAVPVLPRANGGRFQIGARVIAFTADGQLDRTWGGDGRWRPGHFGSIDAVAPGTDGGLVVAVSRTLRAHRGFRAVTQLRRLDAAGRTQATFNLPARGFRVQRVNRLVDGPDGTVLAVQMHRSRLLVARIALTPRHQAILATDERRLPHRIGDVEAIRVPSGAALVITQDDPGQLYEDSSPAARLMLVPVTTRTRIGSPQVVGPEVEDIAQIARLDRQANGRIITAVSAGFDAGHVLLGIRDD